MQPKGELHISWLTRGWVAHIYLDERCNPKDNVDTTLTYFKRRKSQTRYNSLREIVVQPVWDAGLHVSWCNVQVNPWLVACISTKRATQPSCFFEICATRVELHVSQQKVQVDINWKNDIAKSQKLHVSQSYMYINDLCNQIEVACLSKKYAEVGLNVTFVEQVVIIN
jgi:hypothetical protein